MPDMECSAYPYRCASLREPEYAAAVPRAGKAWPWDGGTACLSMRAAPAMGAAPAEGSDGLSEGRTEMGCGPTATTTAQHTARHDDVPFDLHLHVLIDVHVDLLFGRHHSISISLLISLWT